MLKRERKDKEQECGDSTMIGEEIFDLLVTNEVQIVWGKAVQEIPWAHFGGNDGNKLNLHI